MQVVSLVGEGGGMTSGVSGVGIGVLALPAQRRNVEEWSCRDNVTGAIERGRRQTEGWSASAGDANHAYGKVVDSRARDLAGGLQQRQQKQVEVYETSVPGGSLQVFRSRTVSSSSTKSAWQWGGNKWTQLETQTPNSTEIQDKPGEDDSTADFENLQLTLNPLDVSSQKSKVNVGRSGSIGGRRPPSRPRSLLARADSSITEEGTDATPELARLSHMSEICQRFHEQTKRQILETSSFFHGNEDDEVAVSPRIEFPPDDLPNGLHGTVARKKSCSSEDLTKAMDDKSEDADPTWNRGSNVRRSLQFPASKVPSDFPLVTSVSKLRQEIESRRNVTSHAAKPQTTPEFDALEGVLKRVMEKKSIFESQDTKDSTLERMGRLSQADYESKTGKTNGCQGHSFVTVETLNEVRGKLKRMGTESDEDFVPLKSDEPPDDGIVTEDHVLRPKESPSRVMSYVFGMEAMMNGVRDNGKKTIPGTGSLESKKISSFNGSRSEEWYNRRKSYGFEQVHTQQEDTKNQLKSTVESSTDSGICRSSETMMVPSWTKMLNGTRSSPEERKVTCYNEPMPKSLTAYLSKKFDTEETKKIELANKWRDSDLSDMDRRRDALLYKSTALSSNMRSNRIADGTVRPITISLPLGSNAAINRQAGDGHDLNNVDADCDPARSTLTQTTDSSDIKRHSIAVDETRYVLDTIKRLSSQPDFIRRNPSTAMLLQRNNTKSMDVGSHFMMQDSDDHNKKKKVEFCKTEVHFAAEPGRFNLVSTDDKPPPTHIIRGRRRAKSSIERFNSSGLPELRFGDSVYEKQMLTCDETEMRASPLLDPEVRLADETELTGENADDRLSLDDKPRSILKNFLKPQEYILGGNGNYSPESPYAAPMWRSTVTLRNTTFLKQNSGSETEPIRNGSITSELASPSAVQLVKAAEDATEHFSKSVADRIRRVEKMRDASKGFSTRINFGAGEATVIQDPADVTKPKSTVVRIAHRVPHRVPQRAPQNKTPLVVQTRLKSIPLVMSTMARSITSEDSSSDSDATPFPSQLALLRQLLGTDDGELSDDSRQADAEVRALLGETEDAVTEVSGSWSRMRATRTMRQYARRVRAEQRLNSNQHRYGSGYAANRPNDVLRKSPSPAADHERSALPKVTSISLRFEDSGDKNKQNVESSPSRIYANSSQVLRQSPIPRNKVYDSTRNSVHGHIDGTTDLLTDRRPSPTTIVIHPERRRSASTERCTFTTHLGERRDLTPDHLLSPTREMSPTREIITPTREIRTPTREVRTPTREIRTPTREMRTPTRDIRTPTRDSRSPTRDSRSPTRDVKLRDSRSPTRDSRSHTRESRSPRRNVRSPTRDIRSHTRESQSHTRENQSYTRETRSPTRDLRLHEHDTKPAYEHVMMLSRKMMAEPRLSPIKDLAASEVNYLRRKSISPTVRLSPSDEKPRADSTTLVPKETVEAPSPTRDSATSDDTSKEYRRKTRTRSVPPKSRTEKHQSTSRMEEKSRTRARSQSPAVKAKRDSVETESGILEELTRAADEILKAVNGYADEDSYRASSEDDDDPRRRRRGVVKSSAPLTTISESTVSKNGTSRVNQTTKTHHSQTRLARTRVRQTSSNSSLDSLPGVTTNKTTSRGSGGSQTSARAVIRSARQLHRANSRDSSSEDIPTREHDRRAPRVIKRSRAHYTVATAAAQVLQSPDSFYRRTGKEATNGTTVTSQRRTTSNRKSGTLEPAVQDLSINGNGTDMRKNEKHAHTSRSASSSARPKQSLTTPTTALERRRGDGERRSRRPLKDETSVAGGTTKIASSRVSSALPQNHVHSTATKSVMSTSSSRQKTSSTQSSSRRSKPSTFK